LVKTPLTHAIGAGLAVNAYNRTTSRAGPQQFFLIQEAFNPVIPDVQQVTNETRTVFGPVALVELLQPQAGELRALIAKAGGGLSPQRTARNPAALTIGEFRFRIHPAAITMLLLTKKGITHTTVYPARGDEDTFKRYCCLHSGNSLPGDCPARAPSFSGSSSLERVFRGRGIKIQNQSWHPMCCPVFSFQHTL